MALVSLVIQRNVIPSSSVASSSVAISVDYRRICSDVRILTECRKVPAPNVTVNVEPIVSNVESESQNVEFVSHRSQKVSLPRAECGNHQTKKITEWFVKAEPSSDCDKLIGKEIRSDSVSNDLNPTRNSGQGRTGDDTKKKINENKVGHSNKLDPFMQKTEAFIPTPSRSMPRPTQKSKNMPKVMAKTQVITQNTKCPKPPAKLIPEKPDLCGQNLTQNDQETVAKNYPKTRPIPQILRIPKNLPKSDSEKVEINQVRKCPNQKIPGVQKLQDRLEKKVVFDLRRKKKDSNGVEFSTRNLKGEVKRRCQESTYFGSLADHKIQKEGGGSSEIAKKWSIFTANKMGGGGDQEICAIKEDLLQEKS